MAGRWQNLSWNDCRLFKLFGFGLTHPKRSLSRASKAMVKRSVGAMGEDLAGILGMIVKAGFWLDDHYLVVRQIVGDSTRRGVR